MTDVYDMVIVGGGPAGLTAGLYAARLRRRTLLLERALIGGQIVNAERVENFPGFPEGVSGFELGQLMQQQATKYGLEVMTTEVTGLELPSLVKVVQTTDGPIFARAIIVAGGADPAKLGVPGEEQLTGRGVSYCALCDGAFFRDQPVAVIGGGDAAVEEAIFLTRYASQVTVVHRRDRLRAAKILQERAMADPKIHFLWHSVVEEISGVEEVTGLKVRNVKSGQVTGLPVSGVFIYIGFQPNSHYLKGLVPLDATGHIVVNQQMETGAPGVFAAGDIRRGSARQAITAAGDGATAAVSADRYLDELG